jgi:hypothetical protein
LKIAPTAWLVFITTVHVGAFDGMQFEDQPPKVEPEFGVAVSVTFDPLVKYPEQPEPPMQSTPAGVLTTVPLPAPTAYTPSEGKPELPEPGFTARFEVPSTVESFWANAVAVIVVRHGAGGVQPTAVARPEDVIVATFVSLDCHFT